MLADVQRVTQAAQDDRVLTSVLMVQQALVEPKVTVDQVDRMPAGLVEFLLREVNRDQRAALGARRDSTRRCRRRWRAPASCCRREFGWTPTSAPS